MKLARLHRRLTAGMALAALAAFAAGAGYAPSTLLAAAALLLALVWQPSPAQSVWVERLTRVGVLALCAWMLYVAFVLVADFMPAALAMLLFLLVAETLRSLEARNDMRLYSLSFALLIAATAYYPGLGFAAAFVAYIALATLAMMVGYLRRQAEQFRIAEIRIGRPFLVATAAASGVTVLMSAALFVIFPRLPRQWNVQGRAGEGQTMAGFGNEVSIAEHGRSISANPETAFRVEFPAGAPAGAEATLWRGKSFNRFDGLRWTRSRAIPVISPRGEQYLRWWGGPVQQHRIYGGPPGANVLFGPHPILEVRPRSAVRVFREPTGDFLFFGSDAPVYTVTSLATRPSDEMLRTVPDPPPNPEDPYLQLPRLSPRIDRLADSLTAGATSRIQQVRAIEQWLRTFDYTLDLPASAREATLEAFLFRRKAGHCEYFSTALAVLLRTQGIPARNVTGFRGGEWNASGGYLAVTGNDAHSWVEVWFPGMGWVPFDGTPPDRDALVERQTRASWSWPARFWFDAVEHRWYKWVIDYNLDKQLAVFRGVGDLFSRDRAGGRSGTRGGSGGVPREALPWIFGAGALAVAAWTLHGRRRTGRSPEARVYLGLRQAYDRAGLGIGAPPGPVGWVETLQREGAPGAAAAARVVELYLRARFGNFDIEDRDRLEMRRAADAARRELRAARPPARFRVRAGR